MRIGARLALAISPVLVALAAWHGAVLVNGSLGCRSVGKDPLPCHFAGLDLQPALSLFAWWGMLLWVPALLVSGLLVARVLQPLFRPPLGTRGSAKPE